MTAAALLTIAGNAQTTPTSNIGKSDIKVESGLMTPEALWAMGRIATATASPDGKQIVYQVGYYSVKENKGHQVLCIVDANGKNNRQLTTAATSKTDPAWIEQGQRIAYLSGGEVWAMKADGTGREQLSNSGGSIEAFKFSPDGKKVILIKSIPYNDIIKKNPDDLPLATGRLATDLMYRHWDHYVESIQHPFVADVTERGISEGEDIMKGEPYECPMAPFGGIEQLNWSRDSRQIAYTCRKKTGIAYAISTDADIYLYGFDSNVDAFCWGEDSKTLSFIGVWHGCVNIYQANLKGEVRQVTDDWADYVAIAPANDGKKLLALRQSMSVPTDIYIVDPGKEPKKTKVEQVTEENKHILDQIATGKVQQRWVKTTDGKQMLCWIILPANFDPAKKYPTLLFCEGGPQTPVSQSWSYRWNFQIMAANGYVIVAPNRHGLPGFGHEWNEQVSGDWTGQCMEDYLAAIDDAAQNLPFVDRDRLGAVGASFGGFSVYYLAGHHEGRFKCFISHDGAFNLESMYTDTEEAWFSNWEYEDAYWNKPLSAAAKKTYENSPHRFVDKWDTPILCIHGEKDYRINYNQGMGAFNAARMRGIPAELLIFPDENHWVLKPQNGILWQRTFFGWLDRWLKK